MTGLMVEVIGAGAVGASAVKALRARDAEIDVELFARNGEMRHNRTLVNKGVAIGLLEPHRTNQRSSAHPKPKPSHQPSWARDINDIPAMTR